MKKYRLHTLKSVALSLFFWGAVSCVPTKTLLVDIPMPARREVPPSVQSLTLVSPAVNHQYTEVTADSLQKLFYKKNFRVDTIIHDFQMADTTLKSLGELLFESGRFDYVIPGSRFSMLSSSSGLGKELPWDEVSRLCQTYRTDAVLSLDHLKTRIMTDYGNETWYSPSAGAYYNAATASMKIYYEALFRMYDPFEKKIHIRQFISDTLYWEDHDLRSRDLFNRFTPVKQALSETGIVVALELTEMIGARWRPEERHYFKSGNAQLQEANRFAALGEWEEAISRWEKTAEESGSRSLKSKALYNAALGYEMSGDIDRAIKLALQSYHEMYRPLTYEYLEILEKRKNEIKNSK
jgi:tetratricopeptide (TPR) repeat protein